MRDPQDESALLEAYRTLVHRLPEGFEVHATRPDGARKAEVAVVAPDGGVTWYKAAKGSSQG